MSLPYYEKAGGLRFSCTRCGRCCVRPGPVYFAPSEIATASKLLGISPAVFRRRYGIRPLDGVEAHDPPDGDPCVFYDPAEGCTIYEGRPVQCRTWPFWSEVVRRRRSWEKAAAECPGMNRGRLHSPEEIREALERCDELFLPDEEPW